MEQETYLERIKKLKSAQKITNEKLSDMTGIPLGTLSKLLAGISDSPKLSNMVAISQALGCSLDYLITGEPENTHNYTLEPAEMTLVETFRALDTYGQELTVLVMEKEHNRVARQAVEEAARAHETARTSARTSRGRRRAVEEGGAAVLPVAEISVAEAEAAPAVTGGAHILPVVGGDTNRFATGTAPTGLGRRRIDLYDLPVSAGSGMFLDDSTRTDIFIPDAPRTREADFALRISGNSMEPKFHDGDILLIENCESVEVGELGIFILDGAGYFKKFDGDRLLSLNPIYAPIPLSDFSDIQCAGRVIGKMYRK